jgi:hypothetical protein
MGHERIERELQGTALSSVSTRVAYSKPIDCINLGFANQHPSW